MTQSNHTGDYLTRIVRTEDVPSIMRVRTSVVENHLDRENLAALGITEQSLAHMMDTGSHGSWCVEHLGEVVAFAMTDRSEGLVEALFVLPRHEGRRLGSRLLDDAVRDLLHHGFASPRLYTGSDTRAYAFYLTRGWRPTGRQKRSDIELAWSGHAV
jgi:GNAT superfamily N-acetyltransferase